MSAACLTLRGVCCFGADSQPWAVGAGTADGRPWVVSGDAFGIMSWTTKDEAFLPPANKSLCREEYSKVINLTGILPKFK